MHNQLNWHVCIGKIEKMIFPGRKDYISACWEHGRDVHYRQWGSVRHLIPHSEAEHPDLWRPQPPDLPHHVRGHHLPEVIFIINSPDPPDQVINSVKSSNWNNDVLKVPWSVERWPQKAGGQHGPLPKAPLLYAWICPSHSQGLCPVQVWEYQTLLL